MEVDREGSLTGAFSAPLQVPSFSPSTFTAAHSHLQFHFYGIFSPLLICAGTERHSPLQENNGNISRIITENSRKMQEKTSMYLK